MGLNYQKEGISFHHRKQKYPAISYNQKLKLYTYKE